MYSYTFDNASVAEYDRLYLVEMPIRKPERRFSTWDYVKAGGVWSWAAATSLTEWLCDKLLT